MIETSRQNLYCSELATQIDEPLFGTATRAGTWLLLSYAGPFKHKALDEADIPEAVKAHLNAAARAIPHARVQLIRQNAQQPAPLECYIARVNEINPVLYRFELDAYEELLGFDLASIASGDPQFDGYLDEEPLFLVCTHGTHDRCCARYGLPVYTQLATRTGLRVYQTNHMGGHRFAANVLCLPNGVQYGRLSPADITPLIAEHLDHSILLGKYRGRTCYGTLEQVAEYFTRKQTLILNPLGLRHLRTEPIDDTHAHVTFLATADGTQHTVWVTKDAGALKTYTSCNAAHESSIDQYRLTDYRHHAR
jgi:hypothetical protein